MTQLELPSTNQPTYGAQNEAYRRERTKNTESLLFTGGCGGLGYEGATKRNVYIGLRLLYVWGRFVYVYTTNDLRTEGCTFTRVALFICKWVNPLSVGV